MFGESLLTLATISALAGVAVGAAMYALMLVTNVRQAKVGARVDRYVTNRRPPSPEESVVRDQQRANLFADLDKRWEGKSLFKSLQKDIQAANLRVTSTELVLIQIGIGLGLSVALWALVKPFGLLLTPITMIFGVMVVRSYVRQVARKRIAKFESQLSDNLDILAGSVRGGFSLFQALSLMAREAAEPSKTEYVRVVQEISLGSPMATALDGLATRIPTEDIDILVTAITMQQTTGGNLSHILDIVAATIRERHKVKREIKSLTAQQRFSAILLAALPFLLGAALFVISPKYMSNLFQPGWVLCMPIGAFILCIVGAVVMRKMADIEV